MCRAGLAEEAMKYRRDIMIIQCPPGIQLTASLRTQGAAPDTPCGGRGNCGKCRVRVIEGTLPVSTMDQIHLSKEELDQGIRLACQAMPGMQVSVEAVSQKNRKDDR